MVNRKKLHKILTLVSEITERRRGVDGYPYVSTGIDNYSRTVYLCTMKNGLSKRGCYDISMVIDNDSKADRAIKELEELLKIAVDRIEE